MKGAPPKKRIVLTRSREGNEKLAARARAMGFEPVPVDSIELLPPRDWGGVDTALRGLGAFDWLVFTSGTAVRLFTERMNALALPIPWTGVPSVAAVGDGTADALRRSGIAVKFIPSEFLTRRLASDLPTAFGRRVLLLRADIADKGMVEVLRERGFEVVEHAIYRTETNPTQGGGGMDELDGDAVDAILFASPSAVEGFTSRFGGDDLAKMKTRTLAACIGPVTAKAAREHGFERIIMPKTHTFEGLLQEVGRELLVVT